MALRVETVMLGPETDQYAGKGQEGLSVAKVADSARRMEALGFDCATTPEAGHDPYLPLAIAAEHTRGSDSARTSPSPFRAVQW